VFSNGNPGCPVESRQRHGWRRLQRPAGTQAARLPEPMTAAWNSPAPAETGHLSETAFLSGYSGFLGLPMGE